MIDIMIHFVLRSLDVGKSLVSKNYYEMAEMHYVTG